MMTRLLLVGLVLGLGACASVGHRDAAADGPAPELRPGAHTPLPASALRWVDETMASLTLREKAGQLVMPWVGGEYTAVDSPEFDRLLEWVEANGVGGLVMSVGLPHSYAAKLNELQRRARVPLLVASDMENGPGMRMSGIYSLPHLLPQGGGTAFPPVMALGATGSEELTYELGRVLGREARAVGVHITFGPVLDVNSNPANPIINTRSFGEDPALVSRLGVAYIRGARAEGLMTTAKHFPGHGDTGEDSHIELPVITADRARMDAVELPPFRAAVEAGIDAVMTAHIAIRGVEGADAPPATLSPYFMTGVLREEMGFDGLLFTDAMTMGGVADEFGGGAEVLIRALEAGADVLLMPRDVAEAVAAVTEAVESGRLEESRIDASVRRILEAKARAGLHRRRQVSLDAVDEVVGVRAHTELARTVAERSLTLARDRDGLVPLTGAGRVLVLNYAEGNDPVAGRTFIRTLAASVTVDAARVDARTDPAAWEDLRARADSADVVIAAARVTPREYSGTVETEGGFAGFVESLARAGKPVVAVSFGSPYLLDSFPSVPAYLLAWGGVDASQRAAARALLGEIPIGGRLPISLPPTTRPAPGSCDPDRPFPAARPHPGDRRVTTEPDARFVIGLDGGGTATRVAVADGSGRELVRRAGAAGLVDPRDPAASARRLSALVREAAAAAGVALPVSALCAGLAGTGAPDRRERVRDVLASEGVAEKVLVVPDGEVALEGALGGAPGVLLVAGTGSAAWGRGEDGATARCGGWGMVAGDEGSGYAIGRDALGAALQTADGRRPPGALLPELLDRLGLEEAAELAAWSGTAAKGDVAALSPLVIRLADAVDPAAEEIVSRAAGDLARHVHALVERLGPWSGPAGVVFHGGALGEEGLARRVEAELRSGPVEIERREAAADAVTGAVRMALSL